MSRAEPLLAVEGLEVAIATPQGPVRAVRQVDFELLKGRTLGIVGESGCGKSMTALALMRLLPEAATARGRVRFQGRDLLALSEDEMCRMRGDRLAMIFQEPMTSLNPLHTVGRQIAEPLMLHRRLGAGAAREEALKLLDRVGIPNAARRIEAYPHQLSGGQRQRVMIAIALSCAPDILIADEPTTALDVTIQRQILELIRELVEESGMALVLISHDLGVIAETVDEVLVMYGGLVVERGPVAAVFGDMAHPYTRGLFAARPRLGQGRGVKLETIKGVVPDLRHMPPGCPFADRCAVADAGCAERPPPQVSRAQGHVAACIRLAEDATA
ncbi:MAG: ABC transporter ATP-binding protein [Alphaproteobacteria bacterium]|nr:ABC transporter ATP-binding protein [Alphaproteobacteria bacterium]